VSEINYFDKCSRSFVQLIFLTYSLFNTFVSVAAMAAEEDITVELVGVVDTEAGEWCQRVFIVF
jgi:hypothetical protein